MRGKRYTYLVSVGDALSFRISVVGSSDVGAGLLASERAMQRIGRLGDSVTLNHTIRLKPVEA